MKNEKSENIKFESTSKEVSEICFDNNAGNIILICSNPNDAEKRCTRLQRSLNLFELAEKLERTGSGDRGVNITNNGDKIIITGTLLSANDLFLSVKLVSLDTYFALGKEIAAFNDEHFDLDMSSDEEDTSIEDITRAPTFFKFLTTFREGASDLSSHDAGKENVQLPSTKTK